MHQICIPDATFQQNFVSFATKIPSMSDVPSYARQISTHTVQRDTMPNSWQHNKSWVSGKHHHLGQNLSIFTSETPIFMISATEILSMDDFPIYAEYIIIGARTAQRHPISPYSGRNPPPLSKTPPLLRGPRSRFPGFWTQIWPDLQNPSKTPPYLRAKFPTRGGFSTRIRTDPHPLTAQQVLGRLETPSNRVISSDHADPLHL